MIIEKIYLVLSKKWLIDFFNHLIVLFKSVEYNNISKENVMFFYIKNIKLYPPYIQGVVDYEYM